MPEVSVIIPTYNRAGFIGAAIESVLAQTYTDYEIIVVDDGSTDNTQQTLQQYSSTATYIHQNNSGAAAARNTGVAASSGKYLAFLDSDDLFLPNKLSIQVHALQMDPTLGLVAGGFQYIDGQGCVLSEVTHGGVKKDIALDKLLFVGLAPPVAVVMNRDWFDKLEGFHPWKYIEDMDLWYRLALAGCRMVTIPDVVSQYRTHTGNMTQDIENHTQVTIQHLTEFFTRPDIPYNIRQLREKVMTDKLLAKAGSLFCRGDFEAGSLALASSIQYCPSLLSSAYDQLRDAVVAWRRNQWLRDVPLDLHTVLQCWPAGFAMTNIQRRSLIAAWHKALFYDAGHKGDTKVVWNEWWCVAKLEAQWLLNRGAWSILMKSSGVSCHVGH